MAGFDVGAWAWPVSNAATLDVGAWVWPLGGTVTLTWTASTSADIDHYDIYRSGADGLIDLEGAVHDTDVASPWSESVAGLTGVYAYLVRASDGTNQEANLSQMVQVNLTSGAETLRPNEPTILLAEAIVGGEISVHAMYERAGEAGVATVIEMFVNDGAGGAVDWNTSVGSATLATDALVDSVELESTGLTGGLTYLVGVRAKTAALVYDENTNTESVLTDSTAPTAPTLTATVV